MQLSNYYPIPCLSVPYESPSNVSAASVSDTYIEITWDDPSLSPEVWNIFQGYEVYIRRAGTTKINVTQVNEPVNSATIPGLEPLVTYEVSVAAYTLTGVGRKSERIAVNTTFGKVVFKWTSYHSCWRGRDGVIVSTLASVSTGPGSSPGQGRFVFLRATVV